MGTHTAVNLLIGLAAVIAFIVMVTLAQQIGVMAGHGLAPWNVR